MFTGRIRWIHWLIHPLGSTLKVLSLANCGLGPKSIPIVAATLATAGVETVDLSYNRFDPSLLDGIKDKVKLNLTQCRA